MGKHLCLGRFFNKTFNFIKKEPSIQVFPCEFSQIFKNSFSYRTPPVAAFENSTKKDALPQLYFANRGKNNLTKPACYVKNNKTVVNVNNKDTRITSLFRGVFRILPNINDWASKAATGGTL